MRGGKFIGHGQMRYHWSCYGGEHIGIIIVGMLRLRIAVIVASVAATYHQISTSVTTISCRCGILNGFAKIALS